MGNQLLSFKIGFQTVELFEDELHYKAAFTPTQVVKVKDICEIKTKYGDLITSGFLYVYYKTNDKLNVLNIPNPNFACQNMNKLSFLLSEMISKNKSIDVNSAKLEDIKKLSELYEKGILTEDEFQTKKKQILFSDSGNVIYREKETIKEIVKVPCQYCGTLIEITSVKCLNCGAPLKK